MFNIGPKCCRSRYFRMADDTITLRNVGDGTRLAKS
jgi:hypothetical protein